MSATPQTQPEKQSYLHILKSTALIGGSSLINVGFSIIRNKALAVLLGPEGIGLMALYNSILDIAQTLAGLGIQASGVREVARTAGEEDGDRVARTAIVLRRLSLILAVAGALLLAGLAIPVAHFTFSENLHVTGTALLALAVFFRLICGGETALLQGMREIASLARINVISGFASTVASVALIFFLGADGIVPSLIAIAAVTAITSFWYSAKIRISRPTITGRQYREEVLPLVKLGAVFMASGLLTFGAAYAVRLIVLKLDGAVAAGLYQAAWALGGLYAGFILQAMGTDFYPRLAAVAHDHEACNRLVNEQTQVSMLLAGPGILATLTFAPVAMWLFYSPEFAPAADLLRWICLGMMLRIVAWPMGYIVLAKGAQAIFFWTEVAASLVHVGLVWLLVSKLGAVGSGMGFFGLYVWHGVLIYVIAGRLTGFRWSPANYRLGVVFLLASALVFCATLFLPLWQATVLGSLAVLASGIYSLKSLVEMLPPSAFPAGLRHWMWKSA
ncbi:PST family polysaccharide transporter [Pararhizobium capsulatum DSM 1112]|uniref:PST family polysaccharide transporter n=1 Tax=Pararhizobium capsulatum DSM 1112 TaxID=1121113 RepID=A0ABU0BXN7_9HYPH|nr:O-antigen translocase [Pararhizobium capsulatum]MDQ0322190.1 PST family polysaccharide transporter [Pararhizobium capsulatum DSM 1112]